MMRLYHLGISIAAVGAALLAVPARVDAAPQVSPPAVILDSPEASHQVLVSDVLPDGRRIDLTRKVRYEIANPALAKVDSTGFVQPLSEGKTELFVRHGDAVLRVPLEVKGLISPEPVSFQHDVIPILTKARCNSGGCHGKAEGQNGFKLSIFGFDPDADHDSLTKQSRNRRLMLANPDQSLFLRKATSETPHGGGRKIEKGSYRYQRLRRWIAEGAGFDSVDPGSVQSIVVEPAMQVLLGGETQQLQVTAIDARGQQRDITSEAEYESNASTIAEVDQRGFIQASDIAGEAAILVKYLGRVAVCRITLPKPGVKFDRPPEANFIDRLVWDKLQRLGIAPSGLASDAVFLRRASLDLIGTLPTAAEARKFLTDPAPDKRARLIDQLLTREEYVDYWAMRWADILRADKLKITPQGTVAMTRWLRKQFAENRPYDQFVREILTVQGNTLAEGPAAFYKALEQPEVMSRSVSQLFLGVRIECAQCHHHPSEKWSQDDYAGLAGFFTGVVQKKLPTGDDAVIAKAGTDMKHPRTGELVPAQALGAVPASFTAVHDRRVVLADWMTARDNPFFAKAIVNRLWAHYFGKGLVEPIDDLRETNPASNEPLLMALAEHFVKSNFDLKALTRTMLNSRVYQLSSETNASNADDQQNFSHATYKALPAEVLLDAICQATGVPEKFNGWPEGIRAIQIWDNRMPSYFFRIFGRPVRASVCECERSNEPSIAQALHLLNSPEIMAKIQFRHGKARQLADSALSPPEIVDELYLGTLSRFPTDKERSVMLQVFSEAGSDRRTATEDVLWALLNSKEAIYNP